MPNSHRCMCATSLQSCLIVVNPRTVAHQAPLSMGFSRQEHWNGLSYPPPGGLSFPGMESVVKTGSLPPVPPGKPRVLLMTFNGLPSWLSGKESACQCRRCRRHGFNPGLGRSPGEGNGNPLQYQMATPLEKSHGQRGLVGYSPWGCKESHMTEQLNSNLTLALNIEIGPLLGFGFLCSS